MAKVGMAMEQQRKSIWPLLWVNIAVAAMAPLIQSASHGNGGWSQLWHNWTYMMVYANLSAVPAVWLGPSVVERLAARRIPPALGVLLVTLLFSASGSLVSQGLLTWMGLPLGANFWKAYVNTLRAAVLLSVVFGLGAFFYESTRGRLQQTEEKLHEKEMTEQRLTKLAAEARLRGLESRLQPHFLFNTLNSISALIAVDPARAEKMVGRLGGLLRLSLDRTNQDLIPLEQEMAMVEDYVEIESERFGDKVKARLEMPRELQKAKVPPLSIQTLVENAVKYGITPQKGGGEVVVAASAENGNLRIQVADTGTGFDLTAIPAGHGLDNLVGRLDALFGSAGQLRVRRLDGRCVVEMVLPLSL